MYLSLPVWISSCIFTCNFLFLLHLMEFPNEALVCSSTSCLQYSLVELCMPIRIWQKKCRFQRYSSYALTTYWNENNCLCVQHKFMLLSRWYQLKTSVLSTRRSCSLLNTFLKYHFLNLAFLICKFGKYSFLFKRFLPAMGSFFPPFLHKTLLITTKVTKCVEYGW